LALGCHLHNVDFTRNVGDFLSSPDLIGADPTECVQLFHDVSSSFVETTGDGSKPWYLVNPKIAGKWMFIPLKMYL